jgi:hypothetical protein
MASAVRLSVRLSSRRSLTTKPVASFMLRMTGLHITQCPVCHVGRPRRSTGPLNELGTGARQAVRRGARQASWPYSGQATSRRLDPLGGGPGPGHLMKPPVACPIARGSPPRFARRVCDVCPFLSPPALRQLGLPPRALGPPPVPAGAAAVGPGKALPSVPRVRYNPHSF